MKGIFYSKMEDKIIIEYYPREAYSEKENESVDNIGVYLDFQLYQYCLSLGQVEFNGAIDDRIYTISDKNLFTQCQPPILDLGVQEQGLEEIALDHEYRLSKLELGV